MTNLTDYQKKKIILRGLLEGQRFFKAIRAMNFAENIHDGERKDGSHEFSHQVEMALHAWCFMPSLIFPEETLICIFFHDSIEDNKTTHEQIEVHFDTRTANLALGMSKIRGGMKMPNEIYYQNLANDPILSFAKGIDRAHNLGSMRKAFSDLKQLEYLTEARNFTLPMLKKARRMFPEQVAAYEGVKHTITLICNITEHFIQGIQITDTTTDEHQDETPKTPEQEAAILLGRKGGLKGGKARAEKLTSEERIAIAKNGAKARWSSSEKPKR